MNDMTNLFNQLIQGVREVEASTPRFDASKMVREINALRDGWETNYMPALEVLKSGEFLNYFPGRSSWTGKDNPAPYLLTPGMVNKLHKEFFVSMGNILDYLRYHMGTREFTSRDTINAFDGMRLPVSRGKFFAFCRENGLIHYRKTDREYIYSF